MATATIALPSPESALALAGYRESNLKLVAKQTGTTVVLRGQALLVSGSDKQIELCTRLIAALEPYWGQGQRVDGADILTARHALDSNRQEDFRSLQGDIVAKTRRGETIRPKTFRQYDYIKALRDRDLIFCAGPAGTGKTFLAALVAVRALLADEFERIVLTRPAVEAGERLGFLPGDLQQKVDPYLRPLYDALYELVEPEKVNNLMERGIIEIAPLAYMRGRTLNNAFVILDEAQNTTPAQMKMVLTRLGWRSRMVVTGDVTQTDLPNYQESGMAIAQRILAQVDGVAFCQLTKADVVRHPLVQKIVAAYEQYDESHSPQRLRSPGRSSDANR